MREIPTIDGEKFKNAVVFALAAAEGRVPDGIAEPSNMGLANVPEMRFGMALARPWKTEEEALACALRWEALKRQMRSPLLADCFREGEFDPVLLLAAAEAGLRFGGEFDAAELRLCVDRLRRRSF